MIAPEHRTTHLDDDAAGRHFRTGATLAIKVVESHPARGAELQARSFNEACAMMEARSSLRWLAAACEQEP
ncbi:hypothetical protein SAMN02745121_03331 [Nannocystis exedens]|uniref:Uncharacterized protein n=1 Tax=Nannocystis exedens TaxID=54 RepID=A0A1I1YIM3_9BACT|nr:hypothetical protein [Nannocystis exedens]PCC70340.1 hypothetical protein NAEX_03383 [Nannocystis exedens]SFE19445.1 hypothetical protein SAMN02745121_03331 [Nannocystis exedens]